jgi:hypothetical protein
LPKTRLAGIYAVGGILAFDLACLVLFGAVLNWI